MRVGIVGIGVTPFRAATPEWNWKELMFHAATRAYEDAGVDPRRDVDTFVTCAEDYHEGFGIFDEFTPDQLGAVLRPMHTVAGDGLQGLANAFMILRTGLADVAVVEAHSKASDMRTFPGIVRHALDPIWDKPLGGHPYVVAGLEAAAYVRSRGMVPDVLARVVEKNRRNALRNDLAAYGANLAAEQAARAPVAFAPLRRSDIASLADGAVVLVLASEERARKLTDAVVWIEGLGWNNDTPWLASRTWGPAVYAQRAAKQAYRMAGLERPAEAVHVAEVDDTFSYKELQHIEALGLADGGDVADRLRQGDFARQGPLPVNPSGGALGCGNVLEANGLHGVAEVALQLRGEAGGRQVADAERGVVASWRGVPTATGGVAVLGVA
jgi:acetyl-CoA C-acetyltransferase